MNPSYSDIAYLFDLWSMSSLNFMTSLPSPSNCDYMFSEILFTIIRSVVLVKLSPVYSVLDLIQFPETDMSGNTIYDS